MAQFSLPYFPMVLLEEHLPESARSEEAGTTTWLLDSVAKMMAMTSILSAWCESNCEGLTRAFRAKAQPVIRVVLVATLMPDMGILFTPIDSQVGTVTVNMQYALITESGEAHWPKDKDRREISFDPATVSTVMVQVMDDVLALASAGHPLSPAWWRQLGKEAKAQEVEFALAHPRRTSAPSQRSAAIKKRRQPRQPRQPRFTKETYEIESIIEEKKVTSKEKWIYKVRWVGWAEPTWEPLLLLKETEALQQWKEARLQ
jgi:hypothetical protein